MTQPVWVQARKDWLTKLQVKVQEGLQCPSEFFVPQDKSPEGLTAVFISALYIPTMVRSMASVLATVQTDLQIINEYLGTEKGQRFYSVRVGNISQTLSTLSQVAPARTFAISEKEFAACNAQIDSLVSAGIIISKDYPLLAYGVFKLFLTMKATNQAIFQNSDGSLKGISFSEWSELISKDGSVLMMVPQSNGPTYTVIG